MTLVAKQQKKKNHNSITDHCAPGFPLFRVLFVADSCVLSALHYLCLSEVSYL